LTATYLALGPIVPYVQTTAILEVLHVLLGWVRSPLPTTIIQVSSRLFLVWGITEQPKPTVLYTTMILSWSLTEVIRYAFYAFSLLGTEPPRFLTYLRYTTFYVLYPLGAGSEAFLIFATVPSWEAFKNGAVSLWDVARAVLFVIWWPGLYVMYTHMMIQRRKVLGSKKEKPLSSKKQ
ncbi:protein-tyrosine phosphatase-like protein, partial [Amanita rubescens]